MTTENTTTSSEVVTADTESLGYRLRNWRTTQTPAVSQTKLSELLGISQPSVSLIERGRQPGGAVAQKVQAFLDSLTNDTANKNG